MLDEPDQLRETIRAAVLARRPVDARERDSIRLFVEQYGRLERPFDEHSDKVHVTASAILVSDDRRRVLLHRHKRLGLWLQPGGHIDAGESPWVAATREAREETGLPAELADDSLLHVDVHPGPRGHTHLDLRYLVTSPMVPPSPPEGESQDVQWFAWHLAVGMAEPGLEGVLRALQPGTPKIRQVRHTDAAECARVYWRSRAFALPTVAAVHDEREVRRWMADELVGRTDMWVAEVDGTVVGLMVLDHGRGGAGWIEHLYLDPAWVGRRLGERFLTLAAERLPAGIELWCFQVNDTARRFYERHGFVAEEFTDGSGNEERTPDVRYRRQP